MQAHHQTPQRAHTPGQIRQSMQPMSSGMAPPGMHVSVQMGHPSANPNPQPNGAYQQMPSRGPPPPSQHQGPPPRQPRQPMHAQQGPPPQQLPPQPQPGPGQQQQPPAQQPSMPPQQQQQQPPPPQSQQPITPTQRLSAMTEDVWMQIGSLSELMSEPERALSAYDSALRHNPYSQAALTQIANIYRSREEFEKAVEFFQRIVNIDPTNGEIWGAIGNCYLMLDELPKAYQAYQQAIFHLPNPREPKLWYGIGILYDRYGSYDHAEEAFNAVMNMDPGFDKATEIYFRLGIIHKCQGKFAQSLDCFNRILTQPPRPLTETDIWFQIGNVHELNSEYGLARDAYERVLRENPQHGKVLQQLGALYFRPNTSLSNVDAAVQLLMRAIEVDKDKAEAHTWYLLGRCYMVQRQYNKAYEAYQQAVYRDGNNANYWCSIGVLYYQINQYRDALDAYSRAIRINPYLSEVWFDLGALYEACNNQVTDAIDAYTRAADLDRSNTVIEQRLELLQRIQSSGQSNLSQTSPPPPPPVDPPIGPTSTGQPNAPGGPAGESSVTGGAPGSLGAPPMSGVVGNASIPPPPEHGHLPGDQPQMQPSQQQQQQHHQSQQQQLPQLPPQQQQQPPQPQPQQRGSVGSASMSMHHPGHAAPMQPHQQQYSQHSKAPQLSHQQGPVQSGRPGYQEDPGYGRYENLQRPDSTHGPDSQAPGTHYTNQVSPVTSGGASGAYANSVPYSGPQYPQASMASQPPVTTRSYSTSGNPATSTPYAQHPQAPSAGPYRAEDVHMSSRHQSPMLTHQQQHQQLSTPHLHQGAHHHHQNQQQQQHQQQQQPQRLTPVTDQATHSASSSAFQHGQPPVNGYPSFSGPPSAAADAHGHGYSRSPSRLQSPGHRQPPQSQAPPSIHHRHSQNSDIDRRHMRDERPMEHISGPVSPANGASHKSFSRHGTGKASKTPSAVVTQQPLSGRSETRASFSADKDGDVRMDDAQQSAFKSISSREEPGAMAMVPDGSRATLAEAAAIILPRVATTPAPPQDMAMSSSSTPSLLGPTAAPIRLPPVQVSGAGSFSAPSGGSASLGASSSGTSMTLAADDGSKPSINGSLSLPASASVPAAKTESLAGSLGLASAISAADEDNEDSAINSLMSLSNVATSFTTRRQSSPLASSSKLGASSSVSSAEKDLARDEAPISSGVKDGSVTSPSDSAPSNELAAAAASLKVSEDGTSTDPRAAADGSDKRPGEVGSRSGQVTPLAASGPDTNHDQLASSAASSTSFATTNNGVAALVPSKRSLTATGTGDAVVSSGVLRESTTPDNAVASSSGVQVLSDTAVAGGNASGREDMANGSGSSDDMAGSAAGPRKRGRQESPALSPEKQQPKAEPKDGAEPSAPGKSSTVADEMEEGEEFEDGEVFDDDDEASFGDNGSKSRASEDMVMDSGKVKHE